ncbi:MAG TPA: short-chain dehydrogenase, partial [Cryomorphaceae bacterium]|nr:short-chain dehydrogenase [Cryomorphaceae bacterium]
MQHIVWITGASSGIGAALVAEYARQGWHVIATARRIDALQSVAEKTGRA